jgi:hypothetical protein
MATETRITLQMGLIASGVAALIVLIGGAIWNQQGRLVVLETNYLHLCSSLEAIKTSQDKVFTKLEEIRDDQKNRAVTTGKETDKFFKRFSQ